MFNTLNEGTINFSSENPSNELLALFSNKSLTIYDTGSRRKRRFDSISPNQVKLYSCGPTVYSEAHIGNLRAYIFPDILKKVLERIGYSVDHIINLTDVGHLTDDADSGDDKMELIAQKQSGSVWEISKRCTQAFMKDIERLNIFPPRMFTKATDYIKEQINMIEVLEKNGHTYHLDDGIYFDTSTFSQYADFAKLDVANLNEGERVSFGGKRNKTDFALWKFSPKNGPKRQMEWESPWGVGFPGWHIECSAMILKELGIKIDIHTGGSDHIPVHHTNEIAQATCCNGTSPTNYWMHGEFLILDKNEKIGKSKGNSLFLSGLMEKGFDPLVFRYLVLMAHYRSFLTFSENILGAAQNGLRNLKKEIKKIYDSAQMNSEIKLSAKAQDYANKVMDCLLDDLNTAMALASFREMLKEDSLLNEEKVVLIQFFDSIFSLDLLDFSDEENIIKDIIPKNIIEIAEKRWSLKKQKDFTGADSLRTELELLGYRMSDKSDGYEIHKIL